MNIPILFIVFNRPAVTKTVFKSIRENKPKFLYVAADGPRAHVPGDETNCLAVREIFKDIDWDCEIKTFFRSENKGCKINVSEAINWFFSNVEQGIVLEDDCLVDQSFYSLCEENLERYKNDYRVMHISASNFQEGNDQHQRSYYFSLYNHIWGWASWKRAWSNYDVQMKGFSREEFKIKLKELFDRNSDRKYWLAIYDYLKSGNLDTWDYSWMFCMWMTNGIAITPEVNLVTNIGFGRESTHTADPNSKYANLAAKQIIKPIKHPEHISLDTIADQHTADAFFNISQSAKYLNLKIRIATILPVNWKKKIKKLWF